MANKELATLFYEIADILDMKEVAWKPVAYRKAARVLESLSEDVRDLYKKGGIKALDSLPSIGKNIAGKIKEYLISGKVKAFEKLKKEIPAGVYQMMHVQGLGPKKAFKLYTLLHINSLKKLETAAKKGSIRTLPGFGEKTEQDILRGLSMVKAGAERQLLGVVMPIALAIKHQLEQLPDVERVDLAGSLRRMKETIRDIDILVISSQPARVMNYFTHLPDAKTILAQGPTKSSVVLKQGINCDVRVLDNNNYGSGLQYFTGNKEHGVALRNLAIRKGYKLSEYGLFKKKKNVLASSSDEKDIYQKLGLDYIPPELRENMGELDAAMKHKIPNLVGYDDLHGDLHMHTTWSDGAGSTEDMAKAATAKGYSYTAITDHSKSLHIAHGLDEKRMKQYLAELHTLQKKYSQIHILAGSEVDILANGNLDYTPSILSKLDFVIGSVHSRFSMNEQEMTSRLLKALDNPYLHLLGHPTGRLINQRQPYVFDFERVAERAAERNVGLEVNSYPTRLDLRDQHIHSAISIGAKVCINTDSHAPNQLGNIIYGIGQARRGWAEKKHVLNAQPWKKFSSFLQR